MDFSSASMFEQEIFPVIWDINGSKPPISSKAINISWEEKEGQNHILTYMPRKKNIASLCCLVGLKSLDYIAYCITGLKVSSMDKG